jgi:type IV pilus assembly protein PilB
VAQAGKRLGQMLIAAGVISEVQLNDALEVQKVSGGQLGKVLVELGYASQSAILKILAEQIGIPFVDFTARRPDPTAVAVVPRELATRYTLMPVGFDERGRLVVAMADPQNVLALDDLRIVTGYDSVPAIATREDIMGTIEDVYNAAQQRTAHELVSEDLGGGGEDLAAMSEVTSDAPIVKLVNFIITKAVGDRASDIHVEPQENDLRIRYRIDGVLHEMMRSPKSAQAAVISRFKIMADMDIAENRKPQDGHTSVQVGHHSLDLRVSTLPTVYGERVVLRILRKDSILLKLTDLGFLPQTLERFETSVRKPYGAVLVTGPTGSGKSTTLYAAVNVLNEISRHILTAEDPVEYRLSGVNQIQTNVRAGLTFATALRSFLRCSPDIILVGEIRDRETAQIAIESALTGHLVLSTLHTNDSASAVTRLVEMGVEPFLVSSSIACVLAQRLARRLCESCREEYEPPRQLLLDAGYPADNLPTTTWKAVGCRKCGGTGYRGRLGLHEVLMMSEEISHLTVTGATSEKIREVAIEQGMLTLRQDGLEKCRLGLTSVEEVSRVVV